MKYRVTDEESEKFFINIIKLIQQEKIPFLIGGTYAFREYTGIHRNTKDLDIFCNGGNYQRILHLVKEQGFKTEITDARWLAKIINGRDTIDLIFASASGLVPVDQTWFEHAPTLPLMGVKMQLMPPEEFLWSKFFIGDRTWYGGPDIHHMILRTGKHLNWERLLMRMEVYWELLLVHLLMFRFVYPSEREIIPEWLMKELLGRVDQQFQLPTPKDKVCRGPLLSRTQYQTDIQEWGFHDIT